MTRSEVHPKNAAGFAGWLFASPRGAVWFCRGMRWFMIAGSLRIAFTDYRGPVWAISAATLLCLFGEFRDLSFRKRDYPWLVSMHLMASIGASTGLAVTFVGYSVDRTTGHFWHWFFLVFGVCQLAAWLKGEQRLQRSLANVARSKPSEFPPPLGAEYFLYLALPRRNRESLLGCLNEDFTMEALPKFGPFLAVAWYWWKTILFIAMYACENAVEPLIRNVIEPLWRRVVLPLLKWTVAPAVLIHKLGWTEALRAFIDKLR
jgi:hypothetical protein